MPQIGWFELLIIVIIAILVIGPKDFPIVLKKVGSWIATIKKYFYEIQKNVTEITDIELEKDTDFLIPLMPTRMSFGEAFANARTQYGSGSLFTWNGTTYTTSYAEELARDKSLQPDSANVNIVLNATPKGKKGEE